MEKTWKEFIKIIYDYGYDFFLRKSTLLTCWNGTKAFMFHLGRITEKAHAFFLK